MSLCSSSHLEVFWKNTYLEKHANFTGEQTCAWSEYFVRNSFQKKRLTRIFEEDINALLAMAFTEN